MYVRCQVVLPAVDKNEKHKGGSWGMCLRRVASILFRLTREGLLIRWHLRRKGRREPHSFLDVSFRQRSKDKNSRDGSVLHSHSSVSGTVLSALC